MIAGVVDEDGVPIVELPIAGRIWRAIIDTGFNGDVELPDALRSSVNPTYFTRTEWALAAGQTIVEDTYRVTMPFDGETIVAEATFASDHELLLGTRLLRRYRLVVDFVARTILLEKVIPSWRTT